MWGVLSPLFMALVLLPVYLFTDELLGLLHLPTEQGMQLVFSMVVTAILLFVLCEIMPRTQIEHFSIAVPWALLLNLFLLLCTRLYPALQLFKEGGP